MRPSTARSVRSPARSTRSAASTDGTCDGRVALLALLTACGAAAEPTTEESVGGESEHGHHGHGHHGHDGAMTCHGRGPEGDFSDAECFARMFESPEREAWQRPD